MNSYPITKIATSTVFALMLAACNDDSNETSLSDTTPPVLNIYNGFSNSVSATTRVSVSGKVTDDNHLKTLIYSINDQPAVNLDFDEQGNFESHVFLSRGENAIIIKATDNAGNTTESTHDIYLGNTIAAGGSHTAALQDGKLYGWGRNNYGQTGIGMTTKISDVMGHPSTPMLINNAPVSLTSISFNQNHSLAVDKYGKVYSWGEDNFGQLGRGDFGRNDCVRLADCRLDIGAVNNIDDAVMVAAGYKHNLVLTNNGDVWAFGENSHGQLGYGSTNASSTPVKVDFSNTPQIGRIIQISASANSSYALDDKGQLWGWGSNAYSNLGENSNCQSSNGCLEASPLPVKIEITDNTADSKASNGVQKITEVTAGRDHVLAVTEDGAVYGWGLNASSQIGFNGKEYADTEQAWPDIIPSPTKLPWFEGKEVQRVYANGNASYALLDNMPAQGNSHSDGVLYAWGMFGETSSSGRTVYNNLDEPTNKLPYLKDIENMAMGAMHLIAQEKHIKPEDSQPSQSGSLFTWGWSFEGSLGNKDTTHIWMYNHPIPVVLPNSQ